jgi:hypothetical protein
MAEDKPKYSDDFRHIATVETVDTRGVGLHPQPGLPLHPVLINPSMSIFWMGLQNRGMNIVGAHGHAPLQPRLIFENHPPFSSTYLDCFRHSSPIEN